MDRQRQALLLLEMALMTNPASILLVEDDRALLEGIADLLEVSVTGYEVLVSKATDGEMGLKMVSEAEPDLIISDIMMPRMGGFEFLEELRRKPEWVHIPVIFLTARGTPQDVLRGRVSGAELYITKPYDSTELIQLVNSQLDRAFQLRGDRQRQLNLISHNIIHLINHEFRTPLTYVTAYYELLEKGLHSEEEESLREYLEGIQVGTTRLNRLVGNLVQVMRLRTGEAARSVSQQATIVSHLPELLQVYSGQPWRESESQQIKIKCQVPDTLPKVFVDLHTLFYALDCLIDNAIKFSLMQDACDPEVTILAESNDREVAISISDNGIGIPEQVHDRVFELFYQHNRTELEQQGAGLGLVIVKGLVELNGGLVSMSDNSGGGCTVTITLPAYHEGATLHGPKTSLSREKYAATILLVEDEWPLLDGLSDLLGVFKSDYEISVLKASDGEEALQIMDQHTPDLIVSDIMMPRMDGYQLLSQIRANPAWVTIPFIFLTAKGDRRDVLRGRRSGAEEYITKPYQANELFSLIQAQLDRHFYRQDVIRQDFEELKRNVVELLMADIKVPLNTVSEHSNRMSNNLETSQSDEELRVSLEAIQDGSKQVSRIIEEFILLVELRTGSAVDWFSTQTQVTNVNRLLSELGNLWLVNHGPADVNFQYRLSTTMPMVMIDPGLLRYALNRLIVSAVEDYEIHRPVPIQFASGQDDSTVQIMMTVVGLQRPDEQVREIRSLLARNDSIIPELFKYDPALLITKSIICYYQGTLDIEPLGNQGLVIRISLPVIT